MIKLDILLSPVIFRGDSDSLIISNLYPVPQSFPQQSVEQLMDLGVNSIKFQNSARFIMKEEFIKSIATAVIHVFITHLEQAPEISVRSGDMAS